MLRKLLLAAAIFVLPASANAASRVWISEYGVLSATNSGGVPAQAAALPALAMQSTLDLSGGTAQTSSAFGSTTRYIRVICEIQCAIRGDGTAATSSAVLLPALSPEYFGVQGGSTISVIAAP
ncbi:hypothetical protein KUL72_20715 [Bradyrhizobium arachidis]|uniref:hypothetical protein n=1 Tax=Bradyrhizobium arachidis TaxID=858423 RepID=UPI00216258AF|nr:hypothetical protein [Bradyrhizobium arachidis]UVO33939.1 hypothetical protein KUL72_20715 [Bradyrhizobium arachidis]